MSTHLPEIFAIVRQGYRNPSLQILRADVVNNYGSRMQRDPFMQYTHPQDNLTNRVENLHDVGEIMDARLQHSSMMDPSIHAFPILQPDGETSVMIKGWYLPYYLRIHGRRIPVMDFQMRAWIPGDYIPVPLNTNLNDFMHRMEETQRDRMHEIQIREDEHSNTYNRYYDSPRMNQYSNDYVGAGVRRARPMTPPPRVVETIRVVEVPVERVVTQMKALPLPKDIGDILLANARSGKECCPIAAVPFAECESLCVSSCFHIFDKTSLTRWQEDHTTCPVCRCKIENVVYETRVDAAVSEV